MKKKYIIIILSVLISYNLSAQALATDQITNNASNTIDSSFEANQNVQIAISSPYYPVTPGDIYTVSFIAGSVPVSYTIVLDKSYKVRVANLGVIDASGKSYLELKNQVESLVSKNYPMSAVQFVLTQTAQFLVSISGEVKISKELKAWPLSRLSQFWAGNRTDYSSMRKVRIRSASGVEKVYDLFKAQRYGDMSQDPYVRPGDTIIFEKYDRQVTIEGEVKRPGTYQLLAGEGVKDLIEQYGDGYTDLADRNRIELTRYVAGKSESGEKIYLSQEDVQNNYRLNNLDRIRIGNSSSIRSIMYFEGAVNYYNTKDEISENVTPDSQNRVPIEFVDGEDYITIIRQNKRLFSSVSDIDNTMIIREGQQKILLPVRQILYDLKYNSSDENYKVKPNDVVLVPYVYRVKVDGEVKIKRELGVNSLTKLSGLWADNHTEYSSIRSIRIRSVNGTEKVYDLFKAQRYGDMSQDPYVRPGDTIIFEKYDRQVTIEGEVKRPGTYQLLAGEGVKDLIEQYGDGYTDLADRNRIELTRYVAGKSESGEKIYLSQEDVQNNYRLNNLDRISISKIIDLQPVLFIEGAINNGNTDKTSLEGSNKLSLQFNTGMNYATMVRSLRGWLSPVSDTENAYIIRKGDRIPMNLNPMLFDANYKSEYFIEPYDTLVIPFKQYFITVSGAVRNPGRYPYIPDRDWRYYISLAGGFDEQKNSGETITIYDVNGKKLKKTDGLSPECRIVAESNAFLYYYNQYSPVVMTTLSLITTLLSIYAITSR